MKFRHRIAVLGVLGSSVLGLTALTSPAFAAAGPGTSVIYNTVVTSPTPGNLPSVGDESYSINEFGNEVEFAGTNRHLTNVLVEMSSWGCQTGNWYKDDCKTTPGATFDEPVTFNIYSPGNTGLKLIATRTKTFAIPYRPSASPECTGKQAGEWYDPSQKVCYHGLMTLIKFNFSGVTVPDEVVYGITYNTSHSGYHPYGTSPACYTSSGGCGYDSLNITLAEDPGNLTVGTDPNPGTVWQDNSSGQWYCDGGKAGINTFRLDAPACWGINPPYTSAPYYVPAVQFKAGVRNG